MSSITCDKSVISVWFVCRTCKFTFSFRSVDEFLDHKKQKHFSEFQNINSVVFEERRQLNDLFDDENHKIPEDVEIKLFAENEGDIDVELCSNTNTILSSVAQPSVQENNYTANSSENWSLDFNFTDADAANADAETDIAAADASDDQPKFEVDDAIPNLEINTSIFKSPSVLLRRLSPKELLPSSSFGLKNRKNKLNISKTTKPMEDSRVPFTCKVCFIPFKTEFGLNRHSKSHNEIKSGPCQSVKCSFPDCPSTFKTNQQLELHNKKHHAEGNFNSKSSVNKPRFNFSRLVSGPGLNQGDPVTSQDSRVEQAPIEQSNSSDPGSIAVGAKTPIKCGLCDENLESEAEAKVHVARCWLQNKSKNCYCAQCNKTLSSPSSLQYHIRSKHIEGRRRSAKTKENSTVQREHKCHICSKTFNRSHILRCHLKTHLPQEERERPFICEICGTTFRVKFLLTTHLRTHSDERPFKCPHPDCGAAFKINARLAMHLKSHSERLFGCPKDSCSKKFKTKQGLRDHLKTLFHTGVHKPKSWRCNQVKCDKLYLLKTSLDWHMIVAHGIGGKVPSFECDICRKTFKGKKCLTKHYSQTHTEERAYICSYDGCDKAYKDKDALVEHLRREHKGERPFQCELCGKAYCNRVRLKVHMKVHQ